MEREFVPYKESLDLKELGFDEPCFGFFNIKGKFIKDFGITKDIMDNLEIQHLELVDKICVAPTFSQAFRWFREKYSLVSIINFSNDVKGKWFGRLYGHYETHGQFDFDATKLFNTYEEAELECLKKLIEIVKEKGL